MNTKTQKAFTPGPWVARTHFVQRIVPGSIENICELEPLNGDGGEHDTEPTPSPDALLRARATRAANAKLIAAAPELLEACLNAANVIAGIATGDLQTVKKDSPALLQLRAAIEKAL